MSADAWIVGVGVTPFTRGPGLDEAGLAWSAIRAALADAELDVSDVDVVLVGNVFGGPGLGQRVLAQTPLAPSSGPPPWISAQQRLLPGPRLVGGRLRALLSSRPSW